MKSCPTCGAQYDNETLLFCTRDGSPLAAAEGKPEFNDMPSESWEEETIVNIPKETAGSKVFIETQPQPPPPVPPQQPTVQARQVPPYQPPPQKSRIGLTILLTVLSTIAVLALAVAAWWGLNGAGRNDLPVNGNLDANLFNTNTNANVNYNYNFNANYNSNYNANFNANTNFNYNSNYNAFNTNFNSNVNVNINRPTPTPKPSPTPKPTESPDDDDDDDFTTPTPSPRSTPGPNTNGSPKMVDGGVLNGRATSLPQPSFPSAAKAAGASGAVSVSVLVDEQGRVTSARAISGNHLLRPAAEAAARQARFSPPRQGSQAVKMSGMLSYNFRP